VRLLAMDPGLRHAGIAGFENGVLQFAHLVENPEDSERDARAWMAMATEVMASLPPDFTNIERFVFEMPQVYITTRVKFGPKVDPDDLMQLVGVNGAVVARVGAWTHKKYQPRQWKPKLKKETHGPMILAALSEEERGRIKPCAKSLRHNVLDGIGLGLFDLGRINEKGESNFFSK